jgi:lipopolysaccharide/colanic/teichoic acid biosynthesis glycosyltransferase
MLRVLRHYLPLRRALLILSETVLMTAVLGYGMTRHLDEPTVGVVQILAFLGLPVETAFSRCLFSAFLLSVLSQVLIAFNELYDFRISRAQADRASRFVVSGGGAIAVALGVVLLARVWHLSKVLDFPGLSTSQLVQTLVFTMLVGFGLLYLWRHAFHFVMNRWHFNDRVLILGAGPQAQSLAVELRERADSGYEAIGMIPETPVAGADGGTRVVERRSQDFGLERHGAQQASGSGEANAPARFLEPIQLTAVQAGSGGNGEGEGNGNGNGHKTGVSSLFELVQKMKIDVVVVALEDRRGHLPTEELLRCRLGGIAVMEREAVYERITGKIAVEALRPSYLIFNEGFAHSPKKELVKRAVDLVLAAAGVVLTWPLMIATAIAIRLDSPGPVLFKQERIGQDGLPFTVLKFRSMRADAEKSSGPVWASEGDPRITRCGGFLRRTRLDELPQLFNVLAGDMSLVGPRPERPVFVEDLSRQIPYYNQRHIVKPGLTGWAQINYPYGNTVEDAVQKLQYELFYIKNFSVLFDLSILATTIRTVLLRKGT